MIAIEKPLPFPAERQRAGFRPRTGCLAGTALAVWLPIVVCAEPTNGPITALGLTNVPIGQSTLEVVDGGILFVHDTDDGGGVSVQLGEADSGVFLYPLTGYVYGCDTMEGRAYGSVGGVTNQFISSIHGIHNGEGSSGTVTVDFSALGATRLSVFVGSMLLGRISNSSVAIYVRGDGQGCRANPWWRLPDGSFGAIVELAYAANAISIPLSPDQTAELEGGRCIFVRPDDPTNSVAYVSRVDVTASGLGSFCLTDARVGAFYQRHKALGQATLYPAGGRLVIGNLVSNVEDGVFVELPGVSAFDVDLLPLELAGTNATILISGFGTSGGEPFTALGTARIDNINGRVQIGVEMGIAPQATKVLVRSNGVLVGSVTVLSNAATVSLSGNPRITGCAILGKTLETLPGFAVRLDRLTTFTTAGGQMFEGDEVRMLAPEPVVFESLESFVMVANQVSSFTITAERASFAAAPVLSLARGTNGVTLSWPDPNGVYFVEATSALPDGFEALPDKPVVTGNHGRLTVSTGGSGHQFFRLRRRMPSTD